VPLRRYQTRKRSISMSRAELIN